MSRRTNHKDTPLITHSMVYDLVIRQGHSQSEVARMLGTSKQLVAYHLYRHGDVRIPIRIAGSLLPWDVRPEHRRSAVYQRVLGHAEYVATHGRGMSETKLRRLRSFYRSLTESNAVVVYDPSVPPRPGMKCGGWVYRPRDARPLEGGGDGDLLLRVNKHAHLSDEQISLWRLPPPEDWPGA